MRDLDVILTGVPRSGTTLACHLLNKVPDTCALHEPMNVKHFAPEKDLPALVQGVGDFFDAQRQSIHEQRVAVSRHVNHAVPDNPFSSDRSSDGLRRHIDKKGTIFVDKELSRRFTLVMKHTSSFAALLPGLVEVFPVYAMVRNPLSALASWRTVNTGIREGHSLVAEQLDPTLHATLDSLDDELDRQIQLLDWFCQRFQTTVPERNIIRYEDLIESRGRALAVVQPAADQLDEPLENRNGSEIYERDAMLRIGERLLQTEGAIWSWYSKESVAAVLNGLTAASSRPSIAES